MAINSRITTKIKELTSDNKFLANKLISVLNRAEEGRQVGKEIKKIMNEITAE